MITMKHNVTIQEVDNGYVVRVGCKVLVFEDSVDLLTELRAYIAGEETKLSKRTKEGMLISQELPDLSLTRAEAGRPSLGNVNIGDGLARS